MRKSTALDIETTNTIDIIDPTETIEMPRFDPKLLEVLKANFFPSMLVNASINDSWDVPKKESTVPEKGTISHKKSTHKSHKKIEHPEPNYRSCDYLRAYLNPNMAKERYRRAKLALLKYKNQFDSIAFTGMSGAMIAVPIAHAMKKPLILVRKDKANCHSGRQVEGNIACKNYVIVDDLIASGETVERVQRKIFEWSPQAHCIGTLEVNNLFGSDEEVKKILLTTYKNLNLDGTVTEEEKEEWRRRTL